MEAIETGAFYTVKDMAELAKTDKQKVYRYLKAHDLKPITSVSSEVLQKTLGSTSKEHQKNTKYYDETVKNEVIKAFLKKESISSEVLQETLRSTSNETLETPKNTTNEALEALAKTVESLNKQLEAKDKQLSEKDEQIKRLQTSLDRALLVAYSNNVKQIEEPKEEPQKKSLWQRLKGVFNDH